MQIKQAYIYGFGKWVDQSIDFSKNNFQLIYGDNESGKSTLHHFLLFMLFGLSPKERAAFQPKTSSKLGGKLVVEDEANGEYTIERVEQHQKADAVCITADGQVHEEVWLKGKMNGMTAEIYRSIYGFSAADLVGINQMKEADLGDVLLGIGFTGANKLHHIEKRLQARLEGMFRPNGKVPQINKELDELEQLQERMKALSHEEADYLHKKQEMLDVQKQVTQLRENRTVAQKKQIQMEKLQQALPALHDYQEATEQLKHLPNEIAFPQDGLKRLSELKDKLLPLKSERTVLDKNKDAAEDEYLQLKKQTADFPADDIQAYQNRFIEVQQREIEMNQCKQSIVQLENKMQVTLADLDIGLHTEDVSKLHLPFHTEEAWNQLKTDHEKMLIATDNAAKERCYLDEQQGYLETQLQEVQKELLSQTQRSKLKQEQAAFEEYRQLQMLSRQSSTREQAWQQMQQQRAKKMKIYFLICVFAVVLLAIAAAVTKQIGFVFATAGSVFFSIYLWNGQKHSHHAAETIAAQTNTVDEKKQIVSQEAYMQGKQLLQQDDQNIKEMNVLYEKIKDIDIQLIRLQENERIIQQQESQTILKIETQKKQYPFLEKVAITSWVALYHSCKQLQQYSHEIEKQQITCKQIQAANEKFYQQLVVFIQDCNWVSNDIVRFDDSTESLMRILEQQYRQHQRMYQRKSDLAQLLTKIDTDRMELQERISVYHLEMDALFATAKAANEEAYYKTADDLQLMHDLQAEQQRNRKQFVMSFDDETWQKLANKLPKQSDVQLSCKQMANRVNELEEELDLQRKEEARLQAELLQMEDANEHSTLFHESHLHQERLADLAGQWSVLKIAKEMLQESKRSFHNKYIGQVIEKTTVYFCELTENSYVRVIAPTKKQPFLVENKEKTVFKVSELSKGTMDQLYISLRLAVSEIISTENHLPFLIDDGFVHFDHVRHEKMIHILRRIAGQQQILLFSSRRAHLENTQRGQVIDLSNPVRI